MQPVDSKVLSRIYGLRRGAVFSTTRFLDLGSRAAVDKALSRLAQKGVIRRLARGLYDYPVIHAQLGPLEPNANRIAQALVNPPGTKFQATGAYAANALGLSEQVPMRVVFLTTGTPRRVKIGRREIILKRTTPRNIAASDRVSGLVIQAFRHLGKEHIDANSLKKLKTSLSSKDKTQLLADLPLAPTWMHSFFRQICGP